MTETTKRVGALEETRVALERWRRAHGGRGRPIPAALWAEAAAVARTQGLGATARALRMNPAKLARLVGAAPRAPGAGVEARAVAAPAFVALEGLRVPASRESGVPASRERGLVVELASRDGDRMRVELTGDAHGAELAELARAFWSRGR